MSILWRWVISLLVWLSADHDRIATEPARAAAAVSAARASIIEECGEAAGAGEVWDRLHLRFMPSPVTT